MKIETENLIITEFNIDMAKSVHLCSLDKDNIRFMPDEVFETVEIAKEAINDLISAYSDENTNLLVYPILFKNGQHIGHIEAVKIPNGWEVGYHIAKSQTGNGYATEAVKAFIPYIFDKLSINSIYGICDAENMASRIVLEKSGFILEYDGIEQYHGKENHVRKYCYKL